jgi:hypothetical protein
MTSKADISPGNWAALVDAAPAIARAVAASAGSTDNTETELGAFLEFVSTGADEAGDDAILDQLLADIRGRLASGGAVGEGDAYAEGLEQARRAGAIVAVEMDEAEATAVRAWYLAAASRVAQAAREGGVLGIGSKDVSDWERETIQSIADALGA